MTAHNNTKRVEGAAAIIDKTWEIALESRVPVSWIGIDYGLEIVDRGRHVLCVVAGDKTIQVPLRDRDLTEFVGGSRSITTVLILKDIMATLAGK